jgi:hypothetical protein
LLQANYAALLYPKQRTELLPRHLLRFYILEAILESVLTTTSTQGRNKQPNLKTQIDLAYFGNTELEIMIALAHSSSNYVHVHEATLFCDGTRALTSLQITRASIHGLRTSVTKLIDRAM